MENAKELLYDEKKRDKCAKTLVWACFFVYILMLGSKNIYTAQIVEMQKVFSVDKAQISLAMTYYFIVYAIVQGVLTFTMNKINLRIYLTVTAILSSLVTILIAFMGSIEMLYVLCTINGALQAGIYSGCMAVLSKYLPKKMLPFANRVMAVGSAVSGVIAYGIPAIFVAIERWDLSFIVAGLIFFCTAVFFFISVTKMKKYPPQITEDHGHIVSVENEEPFIKLNGLKSVIAFFAVALVLSFVGNTMHYSVMNWIPNMLYEVFDMPKEFSILITLLVPVAMVFPPMLIISLCEKYKNVITVSTIATAISLVIFLPLVIIYDFNIWLSIVLLVLFISVAAGGRAVFTNIMAFKMRTQINTGAYLAFFNGVASIAAGVMPAVAGKIIDLFGYGKLYLIIFIIGAIYLAINVVLALGYNKLNKNKK